MKVLEVVHAFPPTSEGGSEVYADAHARTLARRFGDEVLVLTRDNDATREEYSVRTEQRDGIRIVRINNTFRNTRSFEDSYRNEAIGSLAAGIIDDFKPDAAHVHHLTCLSTTIVTALAERGIPSVMTLHDYWLMCHRGQLFNLDLRACDGPGASGSCGRCLGPRASAPPSAFLAARALRTLDRALPARVADGVRQAGGRAMSAIGDGEREDAEARRRTEHMRGVIAQVTRFLAPSQSLRDRFIEFGVPSERILHSPYGFESIEAGRALQARQSPGSGPAGRIRLGFIGSLMVSKAPHLLIEAARGIDGVSVDLFGPLTPYHGDNSYLQQLAPLLTADGVRHHGPLPHAQIPAALASIDVLVVPSVWPENSPLVIHEAFLAGVPVIGSRIGGIPELVEHDRNGLLFEAGDVADLRRMITRVVQEPGLIDRLRGGIGPVRSIEDDVAATREMYASPSARIHVASGSHPHRTPRLAAVVLNYRTPDDTFLAVRSLLASRRQLDEIIVVNNDDAAQPPAALKGPPYTHNDSDSDRVRQIDTGRNLGFSGGVNVGIRAALERGADAVLLVNSDVILPPDCVRRLEQTLLESKPLACGIVGPMVASRSEPDIIASLGMSYDPSTGRMLHQGFGLSRRSPLDIKRAKAEDRVDGVSGCAMLVSRAVFDAIGLFDEDYFFSFEDLDFCLRARRAGFDTVLVADATAYHEGGRSIGALAPERLYYAARNHLLLAGRATPASSAVGHAFRMSSIVALNLAHAVTSRGAPLHRRIRAVLQGTRDYFSGRVGPLSGNRERSS